MTLDRRGYELEVDERFGGPELDDRLWLRHYLPHWSTREASRARFDVGVGELRLRIDADQPPWNPEHDGWLRASGLQTGQFSGPLGSGIGQLQFTEIEAVRLPAGYRAPKAEVLRLARERIEGESDRKVSDRQLERLIDEVIETNTARTQG